MYYLLLIFYFIFKLPHSLVLTSFVLRVHKKGPNKMKTKGPTQIVEAHYIKTKKCREKKFKFELYLSMAHTFMGRNNSFEPWN